MNTFGDDLIQAMTEALAHAKGEGPAIVHAPMTPREVRVQAKLSQAQMAPLMGMSLSGYRKWEQGQRRVSGPAAALLRLIQQEPDAVKRTCKASSISSACRANPIWRRSTRCTIQISRSRSAVRKLALA